MFYNCIKKKWVLDIIGVLFQVIFIFAFLTIFFFVYVVNVEKQSFNKQMNLVVDSILTDETLNEFVHVPKDREHRELEAAIISGNIDVTILETKQKNKDLSATVAKYNNNLKSKSFLLLSITLAVLITITIILIAMGYCVPVLYEVKEALWVTLFIGLTELIFLLIVAKNYNSADPNKVKRTIGKSIEDWIKKYQKCPDPCPAPCP